MNERGQAFTALVASTLAFTVCFACWVINGVLVTYLVGTRTIPFSAAEVGWLLAAPILTGSLSRVPFGLLADRYGGRLVFFLVMLAAALPLYLLSEADDFGGFMLASLGFGLAGGGFACGVGYVSAWFAKENQGTALGIFGMGNAGAGLTTMIAPTLLIALTGSGDDPDAWRQLPKIYASLLVVTAFAFYLSTRERRAAEARTQTLKDRLAPLYHLRVWRFGLYYFLVFGAFVAIAQWLIPYSVNVYQTSIVQAGLLASLFSLPSGVIRAAGGWLSDRYGARQVMYWVFMSCAISCAFLAVPRMELTSPGAGIMAAGPGTVTVVGPERIAVGDRSFALTPPIDRTPGSMDTGSMLLPRVNQWHEPVVKPADTVAKGQLLAKGVTNIYYPANLWVFAFFVLVFGVATGIGKAAVYKFIPDYFPGNVGTVGGMIGLLGALGGFVLPPLFGFLLVLTGIWATCWLLLALLSIGCLIWMQRVVARILASEAPELSRLVEFRPRTQLPATAEVPDESTIEGILRHVPLFGDLSLGALTTLASSGHVEAAIPGQILFHAGDPGDALYVVLKGRIRLGLIDAENRDIELAVMPAGSVFGELALIDGEPRSATATAVDGGSLFVIGRDDFMRLLSTSPRILGDIMVGMSGKIRQTNSEYFESMLKQERLHAEQERMRTEGEIERHRMVTQMVAGVAHEINTPIGVANHAASIITEQLTPAGIIALAKDDNAARDLGDVAEAAQLVQSNIERADRLIKSFKNLAAHQANEAKETVDLVMLTEEVIGLYAVKARAAKLELSVINRIDGDTDWRGYPGPYSQILLNLIGNAERYAYPEGGGKIEIELENLGSTAFRIRVRDHGRGIPAADLARVWEPFFTTGRAKGGTGLGLAIVRNIVTGLLHGKVAIESKVGIGTAVSLEIPRIVPDPAAEDAGNERQTGHPEHGPKG
ncbi:MAG: MFS transporter [Alphaproteobacteria bacterium]|nr:MFS transporter [Alphaproteobacteria bacterium]